MCTILLNASLPDWITAGGTLLLGITTWKALDKWVRPEVSNAKKEIIKNLVVLGYHLKSIEGNTLVSSGQSFLDKDDPNTRQKTFELLSNIKSSIIYFMELTDEKNDELMEAFGALEDKLQKQQGFLLMREYDQSSQNIVKLLKTYKK